MHWLLKKAYLRKRITCCNSWSTRCVSLRSAMAATCSACRGWKRLSSLLKKLKIVTLTPLLRLSLNWQGQAFMYQREMRCPGTEYFTLTLADYLGLLQKSYVFLFRIILENRCLPPDFTLRISSCRLSSNYINLKCEFFQKKLESFSEVWRMSCWQTLEDFSRLPAIRLPSRHLFSRLFFYRRYWVSLLALLSLKRSENLRQKRFCQCSYLGLQPGS